VEPRTAETKAETDAAVTAADTDVASAEPAATSADAAVASADAAVAAAYAAAASADAALPTADAVAASAWDGFCLSARCQNEPNQGDPCDEIVFCVHFQLLSKIVTID
jgi:hypothetical protein